MGPDYKQIYLDILEEKFPEKLRDKTIKKKLNSLESAMDILKLNKMIFGEAKSAMEFKSQRLRSYDESSILEILEYQKKNKLTNIGVANHYKISRNTIAKWKIFYKV
ncbi:helix-turn-helix domain-containing protein [Chryseobacterium oryctis]|uniref:Helix-turn-helix domain-containing protein n=1 Tax=Chryseobacterium oryctis TaxID=2952618 RepID=A0ABT3HLC7_9FLAO|nr:helix-turn-helix domain-containing protein [Chryseobacterium oryctis]MCW3160468.1 helix-turn-helix domain-containing protein [Chryseobacterium oryctis]